MKTEALEYDVMLCWLGLKDEGADGGKHKDKVIASQLVNLKLFATIVPSQSQIEIRLQPSSSKVVFATLHLTLSCFFLRQGKATYVMSIRVYWRYVALALLLREQLVYGYVGLWIVL